jgi:hypothetical protein
MDTPLMTKERMSQLRTAGVGVRLAVDRLYV